MTNNSPVLKTRKSPLLLFVKFLWFVIFSILIIPIVFFENFGNRARNLPQRNKRTRELLEQLIDNISNHDYSVLTDLSLDMSIIWGKIILSFIIGWCFVYLNGLRFFSEIINKRKYSTLIKTLFILGFISSYLIFLTIIYPESVLIFF